jgi:hypothetical protein
LCLSDICRMEKWLTCYTVANDAHLQNNQYSEDQN